METKQKIKSFTDLNAWKYGHELVLKIYKITTGFPKEEIYCLTNQIRRCAISITSNLAEGFNRKSLKEKVQFYYISLGSLTELQNQLLIARDIKYIDNKTFQEIANESVTIHKIINGLIKSINK